MKSIKDAHPRDLGVLLQMTLAGRRRVAEFEGRSPWREVGLLSPVGLAVPSKPLSIHRREVQLARVGPVVQRLMELTDMPLACAKNASRYRLTFVGYHSENKEIGQIQAIAEFFQQVSAQWPYWIHFLAPEPDNLATLLSMVFPSSAVSVQAQRVHTRISLTGPSLERFRALALSTVLLHDAMAAPMELTEMIGERWRSALDQLMA